MGLILGIRKLGVMGAICCLSGSLTFSLAQAEIYKWKDASGRWQFSDKAPETKATVTRIGDKGTPEPAPAAEPGTVDAERDLLTRLTAQYKPATTIEKVTLAVVGVESALGQGSGFFISDNGYIVTNRHVVRPEADGNSEKIKIAQAENEKILSERRRELDAERNELRAYAKKIAEYKADIDSRGDGQSKKLALDDYSAHQRQYAARLSQLESYQASYDEVAEQHRRELADYNFKSSLAGAAKRFKIYLKDDTQLQANLILVSSEHDLALLKVDGYRTPVLPTGNDAAAQQGHPVFAVGSPLGMRDSVTSGIITRRQKDYLVTDARILPGNSGGPLLNEAGEVIGVNTLKFAQTAVADGFGLAIPASVVTSAFARYLDKPAQ
ncbi:MAG: hypothetical protein CME36_13660 [unclassified Hahellaceae]|nr:hypothetical protein [Hahellaceae bacterium]|tara:strand:- start:4684 stop:5829 length:1146 start_codon:yes stop_codon:yes gene_type:complete